MDITAEGACQGRKERSRKALQWVRTAVEHSVNRARSESQLAYRVLSNGVLVVGYPTVGSKTRDSGFVVTLATSTVFWI